MRLGIDLGGTKVEIIALNEQGQTLAKKRVATPQGNYQACLTLLTDLVTEIEQKLGIQGTVGIGIPGALSARTGRIKNANSTWLIGKDLQGDLQQRLQRPVTLANDANCFTLSEATDGAAQGAQSVFGVILGTGCGGGLVVQGKLFTGVNAIAGEWGHNPLPWRSEHDIALPCYCGLRGCNETFLSGSGLQAHFEQRTGYKYTTQIILTQAQQGDYAAQQLLEDYTIWLAKGLASVINLFDPEVIVLGGGLSNMEHLYTDVPAIWQQWVFSDQVDTVLRAPKYGDSSGVRGAAWLNSV